MKWLLVLVVVISGCALHEVQQADSDDTSVVWCVGACVSATNRKEGKNDERKGEITEGQKDE